MTFQISSAAIYSRLEGQLRTVLFRAGAVNIISGDSRTGKSSILDIIDYCLGSNGFPVRAGVIRKHVAVYALTLVSEDRQLFVARSAPDWEGSIANRMALVFQQPGSPPPALGDISFTFPLDAAKDILTDFTGIDRSVRIPSGRGKATITPSIRQALFFCLQAQNEIANPDLLFHSQGEEWRPQAIRDVLPYFVGAIDLRQAELRGQLRQLRADLRAMEAAIAEAERVAPASGRARALLAEAAETGLTSEDVPEELDLSEALWRLREIDAAGEWRAAVDQPRRDTGDRAAELDERRRSLRLQRAQISARLTELRQSLADAGSFLGQAAEQRERLASLGLLRVAETGSDRHECPLCLSEVSPAQEAITQITDDLSRLDAAVTLVNTDAPAIQRMIDAEENSLRAVDTELARNREESQSLDAGRRAQDAAGAEALRAATVRGRISMFLEAAGTAERAPRVEDRREQLAARIAEIEEALSESAQDDRLASRISLIGQLIQARAQELGLEHSEAPIRLDPRKLTVVADHLDGPVPLSEMGSGENWVGYHVAAMLGLHEWFAQDGAPVPQVLLIDQPSQVYFPADYTGTGLDLAGEDRANVLRIYDVVARTVERLSGALQVIVTDHADLDDPGFQSALVERWRDGQALVPQDWIDDAE